MARIVLGEIASRLHLPRVEVMPHHRSAERVETPPPRGLPGSLVQIRSREEIEPTPDPTGRNKGLWFDRYEMLLLWQDLSDQEPCGAVRR